MGIRSLQVISLCINAACEWLSWELCIQDCRNKSQEIICTGQSHAATFALYRQRVCFSWERDLLLQTLIQMFGHYTHSAGILSEKGAFAGVKASRQGVMPFQGIHAQRVCSTGKKYCCTGAWPNESFCVASSYMHQGLMFDSVLSAAALLCKTQAPTSVKHKDFSYMSTYDVRQSFKFLFALLELYFCADTG